MKKRLLFVIDSLGIGGAEKSLVTLLNLLDYTRYEVDLQLFAYGGTLEQFLPETVNVLPKLEISQYLSLPIWHQILHFLRFCARMEYSWFIRERGQKPSDKACIYWQTTGRHICDFPIHYDVVIAYAQGVPSFYAIDKVSANKKLLWINGNYCLTGKIRNFQHRFYKSCDTIVLVSDSVYCLFKKVYPEFENKMHVMWDVTDSSTILKMSELQSEVIIDKSLPVIVTVGRLVELKGYDLALETANILRNRGIKFYWYAIGEGPYRKKMEQYIQEHNLQNHFVLLGSSPNPYSYMRQCDIYVQTSRQEGFGLTIAEARILNKPVVCTNFEGCTMQMVNGKNGLITSFNPEDIADAIERLLNDKTLYSNIQEYLRNEKKGNTEKIEKFYELIEG